MKMMFNMDNSVRSIINDIEKESILLLLTELKDKGEVFNSMGGSLYSSIIADQMTEIHQELWTKYGVKVEFIQPCDGRVLWKNLDELIEKYSA